MDEALKKDIKDWAIEARQWTKYKKVRQLKHDILKNTEKLDISSIMLKKHERSNNQGTTLIRDIKRSDSRRMTLTRDIKRLDNHEATLGKHKRGQTIKVQH